MIYRGQFLRSDLWGKVHMITFLGSERIQILPEQARRILVYYIWGGWGGHYGNQGAVCTRRRGKTKLHALTVEVTGPELVVAGLVRL
jgi:hypothetical protein